MNFIIINFPELYTIHEKKVTFSTGEKEVRETAPKALKLMTISILAMIARQQIGGAFIPISRNLFLCTGFFNPFFHMFKDKKGDRLNYKKQAVSSFPILISHRTLITG
jgi:hypothetical protein